MGRRGPMTDMRRNELTQEICEEGNYLLISCVHEEEQKRRNAASQAKRASSSDATRAMPPKKAKVVKLSEVHKQKAELKAVKESSSSASRKLSNADQEERAQAVSDKAAKKVMSFQNMDAPVKERIEKSLRQHKVSGQTKTRAQYLSAKKSMQAHNQMFAPGG